ncbi:hypothetical protein BRD13_02700 [Halobacteriales archaeon SW_5_70_135]|nr:MAG: hypothetical protein BRD13_02700 [Halobacteriales archaeon SW_5_70_135]
MNDRVRAKPPATEVDRWREGVVRAVRFDEHERRYTVVVEPADEGGDSGRVEVTVSESIYDLFVGRIDGDDPVGETAWVR